MKNYNVIILGGSAAGIAAAQTAKRHYPNKSIAVIRKEDKVPIPCGIPYVFGTVGSNENNLIPDAVLTGNGIDLILDSVTEIDRKGKKITTSEGKVFMYDRLILATGSEPFTPPISGVDKKGVFVVKKDVHYLDNILAYLENVKNVIILGGGFIGVEFADELRKKNFSVTIVEMLPHTLMLALEEEFCAESDKKIISAGVNLVTGSRLEEILGDDKVTGVKLSDGRILDADMVLLGIGVKPNISLAEDAGLKASENGILVDSHMRTSDKSIFACGDCTAKSSFFTGKEIDVKLASVATMEARVAGANLFEIRRERSGVIGVFSTIIDGTVYAMAGLGEKNAEDCGFDVVYGVAEAPNRHPGGMPGMVPLKLKLVFNRSNGELIGGSARGGECWRTY